jgi:carboxyl-terminal processing protease
MLTTLLLAIGLALPAVQDTVEVDQMLADRIAAVAKAQPREIWSAASSLVAAASDVGSSALDRAIDARLAKPETLPESGQLLLISARLLGAESDRTLLATRLESLLDSKDEGIAHAAASLLCDPRFRELKDEELDRLCQKLLGSARDANRAPALRLESAVALYIQGRGNEKRAARKEMLDFLGSADVHLRNLGALALARVDDVESGRAELQRMAELPSEEGRLAAAILKQEDIRRLYDRKQKNLLEYTREKLDQTELKGDHDLRLIEKVMRVIETASLEGDKVKREDLVAAALDGMLRSLDEHSSYMTPKVFKDFTQDLLQPQYGGIGAYVHEDPDDKLFTIRQPIYSGPAYRAGLHSDDKILRIGDWPTIGKPVDEIIKRLKGEPGTPVKLYIWRRGMDASLIDRPTEDMAVVIQREEITIPPVKSAMLPGNIGLIELTTFSRVASDELAETIRELKANGARGLILDLRNNTGGLLTEAAAVSNLFLPKKKLVVTTESRGEDPEKLYTRQESLVPSDMPVAVLINRFSASASEIVSGALQDYQRATIVGQASFGKGSVQQLLPIPGEQDDQFDDKNGNGRYDLGESLTKDFNGNGEFDFAPRVRLTVARYLLPSGRSIHREIADDGSIVSEGGVQPDDDELVLPRRFESWKLEEFNRLVSDHKIRDYLDENYAKHRELFHELASGDRDDTSRYPGFDAFYNALGTSLSTQDVRFLLRREVRGRVQDDRGATFPDGDYEEDPPLQEAIRVVLGKLGTSESELPDYASTFEPREKKAELPGRVLTANLSDQKRNELRHALSLIGEARNRQQLSREEWEELERTLLDVLDK